MSSKLTLTIKDFRIPRARITLPIISAQIRQQIVGSTQLPKLIITRKFDSYEQFQRLYKKRWSVEQYHKSLKQNTAIGKSPTRTVTTQLNNLFGSILAYVKFAHKLNHFALKSKLYDYAIKAAFKELSILRMAEAKLASA